MYNNGDYGHDDQQQHGYGDEYGHTDGHEQYTHGGDEYNEWDLETVKSQLREKCGHYANDHANDGKYSVSIFRGSRRSRLADNSLAL
jgi:hypothetical protein